MTPYAIIKSIDDKYQNNNTCSKFICCCSVCMSSCVSLVLVSLILPVRSNATSSLPCTINANSVTITLRGSSGTVSKYQ